MHSKSYSIPSKFLFAEKLYYLRDEIIYDTVSKNTSHFIYYPNGVVRYFYKLNNQHEYVGDEITYNEEGNVIKVLRPHSGKNSEIIYIDTKYWPNYKKNE